MTADTLIIRELADSEAALLDLVAELTIEVARLRTVAERELHDRLYGDIKIKRLKLELRAHDFTIKRLRAQLQQQECAV